MRYEFSATPGKAAAVNYALERIASGLAIFLDDDVRVDPRLLEAYARTCAEHGDAFYGGPLSIDYDVPPPAWLVPHLPPSAKGWEFKPESWPWFLGANWAAPVDRIRAVGGFDPRLGSGAVRIGTASNPTGLETDLQRRLRSSGCTAVYVPEARVWHYVPADACSPAWARHRHYRYSMTAALEHTEWYHGRRLFGLPLSMLFAYLRAIVQLVAVPFVDEPRAFRVRLNVAKRSGHLRGAWLRRQRTSTATSTRAATGD